MMFSYNEYLFRLLQEPLRGLIYEIMFYICVVIIIYLQRAKGRKEAIVLISLSTLFVISMLYPDIKKLRNGGIYLKDERETDALIRTDYIDNIYDPSNRLHGFASHYGADIEMDGVLYFIESVDGFEVGDEVEIKYLPKSRCVLEIRKVE